MSFVPEKSSSSQVSDNHAAWTSLPSTTKEWLAAFAGIVALAAMLETAQLGIHYLRTGGQVGAVLKGLPYALAGWFVRAGIIPFAAMVGNYLPIEQPRRMRNLCLHFLAAAALTPVFLGLSSPFVQPAIVAEWLPRLPASRQPFAAFGMAIWLHFIGTLSLYWLALGITQAQRSHQRYLESLQAAAELERESNDLLIKLSYARLSAMKTQINPEFISRTLAAIGQLASQRRRSTVIATTTRLARLLRSIVDEKYALDSLASDLALLNDYLGIERVRLGGLLKVRSRMPPEILNVEIPAGILRLLAQMMIDSTAGAIQIQFAGRIRVGRAEIYVEGPIPEHARNHFAAAVASLSERLNQLYGERHAITVRQKDGRARVTITAPIHTQAGLQGEQNPVHHR